MRIGLRPIAAHHKTQKQKTPAKCGLHFYLHLFRADSGATRAGHRSYQLLPAGDRPRQDAYRDCRFPCGPMAPKFACTSPSRYLNPYPAVSNRCSRKMSGYQSEPQSPGRRKCGRCGGFRDSGTGHSDWSPSRRKMCRTDGQDC